MKKQECAGFILFYAYKKQISYLILHYASGHWDFPKGKIEPGETQEQAAVRELFEETGLQARIIPDFTAVLSYRFKETDGTSTYKTVHYFLAQADRQSVVLSHEHQGYEWLSFEEAMQRVTYKNARLVLQKAHVFLESWQKTEI